MYCTWLAGNAGCKKLPQKNRRLGTIAQLCRAISSQLRCISTIGKDLLSSNISSTCLHNMVNFSLLAAETVSLVWGTPANFNSFRVLASLLQRLRSTEANQTLHNVWPLHGLVDYTPCLKKRPTFTTCYNFYIHSSIATIFDTNVAEKVGNQNILYFPTSHN